MASRSAAAQERARRAAEQAADRLRRPARQRPVRRQTPGADRPMPWVLRAGAMVILPVVRLWTVRSWHGTESLRSRRGGFLVVANHVTSFDPIAVGHVLYDNRIAPRFLAKAELFTHRFLGPLMRQAGQIPVHRGSSKARDSLSSAIEAITAGEAVIIFPEGTLTWDPDMWPMTMHSGAARIAARTGCPIVPVATWGNHEVAPPRGSGRPRRRPHTMAAVGEPLDLSAFGDPSTWGNAELDGVTRLIRSTLTQMVSELRGEPVPGVTYSHRTRRPL
jgi:1-acyl-sn-glycerol-3-phosphate acyltransferase